MLGPKYLFQSSVRLNAKLCTKQAILYKENISFDFTKLICTDPRFFFTNIVFLRGGALNSGQYRQCSPGSGMYGVGGRIQ